MLTNLGVLVGEGGFGHLRRMLGLTGGDPTPDIPVGA